MPLWEGLVDSAGVLLFLLLFYGLCLVFRRRWISRHGGTFELEKRFDGGGYPRDGKKGCEIPWGARILKVALDCEKLLGRLASPTMVLRPRSPALLPPRARRYP